MLEVRKRLGKSKMKVIFDSAAKRDNTTAREFLTGAGLLDSTLLVGDADMFTPPTSRCPRVCLPHTYAAVAKTR